MQVSARKLILVIKEMSKRNKKFDKQKSSLPPATKQSVIAVLLIGLAIILLLASFEKAGPVGKIIYLILGQAFGAGYYILPAIAFLMALAFLFSTQQKFFGVTFLGAVIFLLSALGLLDIIFPDRAGLAGMAVGSMEFLLGYTASLVLTATLVIAGLLMALNASLRFIKKSPLDKSEANQKLGLPKEDKPAIIMPPDLSAMPAAAQNEFINIKVKTEEKDAGAVTSDGARSIAGFKPPSSKLKTGAYNPPPLTLLKSSVEKPTAGDLRANANIIKRTLESFGIPVEMGEINIGPKVTRYTLKPAEGVKLSRIIALNSDLALALAAHPIRIEAPIPGKSLVGIEVPNKSAAIVRLGSLMGYQDFQNASPLTFMAGRDVSGEPILADIEKMPHLLVAGATGSGKSVAIHSIIVALLYKNSPETLRMILIDPKRVELSAYANIPHLITPVITDGKKTIGVFRWAIQEMERRYEVLLGAGARDIRSYNKSSAEALPYILIVVDELADLMAAYGKEIESSIVRLAQMARATGIHLIVSTQRPSVEVITGLIKANITSRIAMQVASQVDSRTILDTAGAEKLLGGGDLLFISSEFSKPKRIQGAYISEEEIKKVAEFIREHSEDAEYEPVSIGQPNTTLVAAPPDFENLAIGEDDELFDEATRVVKEAKKASASLLQRRLKVGYARAARLLDIMEAKGLIGPGEGAKPREILMDIDMPESGAEVVDSSEENSV